MIACDSVVPLTLFLGWTDDGNLRDKDSRLDLICKYGIHLTHVGGKVWPTSPESTCPAPAENL